MKNHLSLFASITLIILSIFVVSKINNIENKMEMLETNQLFSEYTDDNMKLTINELSRLVDSVSFGIEALNAGTMHPAFEENKKAVLTLLVLKDTMVYSGTAFVVDEGGLAFTNHHVVDGADLIMAFDYEGNKYDDVQLYSSDSIKDLASIKLNHSMKYKAKISLDLPKVGDKCFVIGNPQGYDFTLSEGIVSALRGEEHWIQTTSDVSKGSSGSPVFNQKGEVIGIISKGDYDGNLNFAYNLVLDNLEYFIEKTMSEND